MKEHSNTDTIQKIGNSTFIHLYTDEEWDESDHVFNDYCERLINVANISHIEEWMPVVDEQYEKELDETWRPDKRNKFGIKIKMNDGTEYISSEFCISELLEKIMEES